MIVAKISPSASFVKQVGPFAQPQTEFFEYFAVFARPYIAGSAFTNFEVQFGTCSQPVNSGELPVFNRSESTNIVLSSEELSTWGTDDTILLNLVAGKMGTSVISTVIVRSNLFN